MKLPMLAIFFTAALSSLSFAGQAAEQINQEEVSHLTKLGVVSISGVAGSPEDAIKALEDKANKAGANYFKVIGLNNPGDSSHWMGVAEIYR